MAFTEQNKADAYLFFVLAFNAAPGTVYGGQIVEAYESGMTTAEIVAEYTTKEQFLKLYPASQTNAEFATSLVNTVASTLTAASVKAAAVADIQAALTAGWTKAQVITQILGNLAKKNVADAEWGTTVAQVNNKVAVAQALTEGAKALNTTDVTLLQSPVKTVTQDPATVATAIKGAGDLAAKLDNLLATAKDKATFAAALDLDGNGVADGLTSANVQAQVTADVTAKAGLVTVAGWAVANTAAVNKAAVDAAKATNSAAVAVAEAQVLVKQADAKTAGVTDAQIAQSAALTAAVKATADNVTLAAAQQAVAHAEVKASLSAADQLTFPAVAPTGEVTGYVKLNAGTGKLELDTSAATKVTAANQALVSALVAKAQAKLDADTASTNAVNAKNTFTTSLDADVAPLTPKADAIAAIDTAKAAVLTEQAKNPAIDKTLAAYEAAKANNDKLVVLDKAIADAEKAFTDAGFTKPVEATGALVATAGDDTYFAVGANSTIGSFGLLGKDSIYVGKGYEVNASADLKKGDDSKLEVFFKVNGGNTDVYIEQKAFGSSDATAAAGNANIAKITLTGVVADKLVLKDGFVTIAA
ncbi:Uncharacterised protein [Comamonas aquatica]|nr:hypothetical protein [Comamonas aquatica]CAB5685418.1 Uncharacterised protein [Comamonas aquatica]CAC9196813.1 Uncharacterised protein [Comamonas aquatica]